MMIYCLSLSRAKERRKYMEEVFSKEDITYLTAVDGLNFTDSNDNTKWDSVIRDGFVKDGTLHVDSKMAPTHVACNLSHLNAINLFLKTDDSCCVVLEDDVMPTDVLEVAWREGKKMQELITFPDQCDMLYLCDIVRSHNVIRRADGEGNVKQANTLMGYAITRKGAEVLLSVATPMMWLLDQQFAVSCYPKHKFNKDLLPEYLKGKPEIKAIVSLYSGLVMHSKLANNSYLGHNVNSNIHPSRRNKFVNRVLESHKLKLESFIKN